MKKKILLLVLLITFALTLTSCFETEKKEQLDAEQKADYSKRLEKYYKDELEECFDMSTDKLYFLRSRGNGNITARKFYYTEQTDNYESVAYSDLQDFGFKTNVISEQTTMTVIEESSHNAYIEYEDNNYKARVKYYEVNMGLENYFKTNNTYIYGPRYDAFHNPLYFVTKYTPVEKTPIIATFKGNAFFQAMNIVKEKVFSNEYNYLGKASSSLVDPYHGRCYGDNFDLKFSYEKGSVSLTYTGLLLNDFGKELDTTYYFTIERETIPSFNDFFDVDAPSYFYSKIGLCSYNNDSLEKFLINLDNLEKLK